MNVSKIHDYSNHFTMRCFCAALAMSLFYSSSATSFNPIFAGAQERLENSARRPKSAFTEKPTQIYLGNRPGRDPMGRGGIWTPKLLADLKKVRLQELSEAPLAPTDLAVSITPLLGLLINPSGEDSGGIYPGEGTGGGSGGGGASQLNSNTGNRHVAYSIVDWSARGDSMVNFKFHHNSKGAYSFDLGKGWSHGYDVKITHNIGSSAIVRYGDGTEYPYSESLGTFTPPAGIHDDLVHNGDGTWTITCKDRSILQFNTAGRLVQVKDKNDNTVTITRNSGQKITSINDGTGRSLTFSYASNGLISQVTDPKSRTWTLAYDSNNDLSGISYPNLNSVSHTRYFTYDSLSNILTETDLRGKVWTFTYDSSERLSSFTNPLSNTWTWSYSTSAATMTQPNGKTMIHNYSGGFISSEVDQAGYSNSYVYDADRNMTSLTDKRGKVWTATYDSKGNPLTQTNPLSKTTTYTYSTNNDLLTITNPLAGVTTYTYDSNGNMLTAKNALNNTTQTLTYNSYGEPATITNATGIQSVLSYNSQGDLAQIQSPGRNNVTITCDALGRVTSNTDSSGNTTTTAYDEWERLVSTTAPGSATTSLGYDLESSIVSSTDPLGRTSTSSFDDAGQLSSQTNAKSEVTSFTRNSVGYVLTETNARSYSKTYTYTDRGEVLTLTLPDGAVEQYAYNGKGEVTAYVNPLGQTIAFIYDDAGNQTGVDYPTGLTDSSFGYDNAGRQTSMSDVSGTSAWTLNAAGEITALNTPQGSTSYTYNAAGQVLTMSESGVGTTTTTYDSAGRTATMTDAFGDVTTYTYDTAGRVSRKDNQNGTYELYGYDTRNRVTSMSTKDSSGTVLQSRTYTFDAASQVTQVVEGGITTTYGYDNNGQLTSESKSTGYSATYTYDANGNRVTRTVNGSTETYSYDSGDKLLAITGGIDPRTFAYDAAGRTTDISRSSGTTTFSYDYESRVTSITKPGMTTNSFAYNGLDTRVGVTDSTGTRSLKRNGIGVLASVVNDGTASYTPSGEVRGSVKTTNSTALKNIDTQTSSTGVISASRVYDAFGNDLSSSGSWTSPFSYAGQFGYQQDADTGLKLLGHRYYDSSTGRFLTRDPAKHGTNWYAYCNNNPVTFMDATGLLEMTTAQQNVIALWQSDPETTVSYDPKTGIVTITKGNMTFTVDRDGKCHFVFSVTSPGSDDNPTGSTVSGSVSTGDDGASAELGIKSGPFSGTLGVKTDPNGTWGDVGYGASVTIGGGSVSIGGGFNQTPQLGGKYGNGGYTFGVKTTPGDETSFTFGIPIGGGGTITVKTGPGGTTITFGWKS